MQALANLSVGEIVVLWFIILGFCAFGITLLAVSVSAALSSDDEETASPKPEVTPARFVSGLQRPELH
jgi:hypothetical protein